MVPLNGEWQLQAHQVILHDCLPHVILTPGLGGGIPQMLAESTMAGKISEVCRELKTIGDALTDSLGRSQIS